MLSLKNKKQNGVVFALALFLFSSGVFFFDPSVARADWFWGFSAAADAAGSAVSNVFKGLLLGIFLAIGSLTSVAITMFEWAIKPENISGPSGLLNSSSVYDMWKFVRDFFNLFFILTLLYTAFTIVFQVAKDYKKTLLSLVLAALFVNFSFPITRVLIDVTNVPMYYFINEIAASNQKGGGALGSILSASQLKGILIPGAENGGTSLSNLPNITVSRLLLAIVFIFIFTVSLLVLAVMFVVRLVALVMLLIFSSVGFAASVIPGMESYGSKWWDNLSKYALFGPAAALMLFISTRFFQEIAKNDTSNQFFQSGLSSSTTNDVGFIASMAMFAIPIIMLWMAIGMASSMSIVGAGAVVGLGQSVIKGAGKRLYNNPVGRGLYGGAKKVGTEGKIGGFDYGKRLPGGKFLTGKYWAAPSDMEATIKGGMAGGWGGGAKERAKLQRQAINEQVKKNKEDQVSDSTHIQTLSSTSSSAFDKEAAALSLAESKGIRNAETLALAINAVGDNQDAVLKILDSAKPEAMYGMTKERHAELMNSFYEKDSKATDGFKKDEKGNRVMNGKMKDAQDAYNGKLKKEGQLKIRVDYEIDQKVNGGMNPDRARTEVYGELIGKLSSDDLAKQGSIHSSLSEDALLSAYLREKVKSDLPYYQEAYKKMSKADRDKWDAAGMFQGAGEKSDAEKTRETREKIKQIKEKNGR